MRMNRGVAALLIAVLLLAGIGAGLWAYRSRTPAPAPAPVAAPVAASQPAPAPAAAPGPAAATAKPQPAAPEPFAFSRLDLDTSKETAEACLSFTEPLLEGPAAHYEDYVSVAGHPELGLVASGARLCLTGLAFGKDYRAVLRAGLPARSGAKLAAEETVGITFSDRAPSVRFATKGQFILPRTGNAGVPLSTVNLDEVALRVYRVSDRALFQNLDIQSQVSLDQVERLGTDTAVLIWSGKMAVRSKRNDTTLTAFPIRELVKPWKPGAYVVIAAEKFELPEEQRWRDTMAAQVVYDTDLGLTLFRGGDGLNIFVRSIESAKPIAGASLVLIAHNNDELARSVTDGDGHARFAPGLMRGKDASEPLMVMAYGPSGDAARADDFNRILLTSTAFDLSDRGVSGRPAPGALDVYIATERGIYRPGETVQLVALMRDAAANAVAKAPVSLVIRRPDGVEQTRLLLTDAGDGGAYVPFTLSAGAERGLWSVSAALDRETTVGKAEFMVDDFVPQRLKLSISGPADPLGPGDKVALAADVRFLYGAPASGLSGEAELQIAPEPTPFPAYAAFHFGRADEKLEVKPVTLEVADTDEAGKTSITGGPLVLPKTSLPLKADVSVGIHEPGGRLTKDTLTLKLRTQALFIGLRPLFEEAVPVGDDARFEILALDAAGKPQAHTGLRYELIRRDAYWQWYETTRGWSYEADYRDVAISAGSVDALAERPASLSLPLARWGRYVLTVSDPASGAVSSLIFRSGWWDAGPEAADTPDKATVVVEREKYRVGEMARVTIKPPFEADVLLAVAGNKLFETRELHVPAEGATIEVPVSAEWGSGAYVMATAYRPLGAGRAHEPVRAVGVSWLAVDLADRTLGVKLTLPERIRPRESVTVPIQVSNLAGGESAHLTLAAVDEGILQLTHFKSPSPAGYYYAKRQLGIAMRDDYGHLLDEREAPAGSVRVGGDSSLGGASLAVVPTKTVALFSGLIETDKDGRAEVSFEVPDFEGQLRFMAIAYDKSQLGAGEANVAVRDAVVADATFPRFLAPGDQSRIALLLHNVEGAAGDYKLMLSASGAVAIEGEGERTVTLAVGERKLLTLPLSGKESGIGGIMLAISGPGGFSVEHDWQIAVRPPQMPLTRNLSAALEPGQAVHYDGSLVADLIPGSASVGVTLSSWRGFNIPALLGALDRYPYGCLEQTTSRAFPLLYFNEVAAAGHEKQDKALPERVQQAIGRVLDMQTPAGDFGLWGPADSAYPWLSVFALDFLYEAKKAGYVVPQAALQRGLHWLSEITQARETVSFVRDDLRRYWNDKWHAARIRAYAFYLLAKMNATNLGDLRYFHDNQMAAVDSALGYGQTAAALAMSGDRTRAANAFKLARQTLERNVVRDYYGSRLRDLAALVAAASEAGERSLMRPLLDDLALLADRPLETTTQEDSWMLIAAHDLLKSAGAITVERDGKAESSDQPITLAPDAAALAKGIDIRNTGDKPIWSLVTVTGTPREPEPAEVKGFSLERRFLSLDGDPVDPATLKQNDRLIVALSGTALDKENHDAVVVNLLPAGWEIESIVKPPTDENGDFAWLKLTKVRMREARDDRFVAAISFGRDSPYLREDNSFNVAFIVRATIPGTYALPPAWIEDMYHPVLHARTEMGTAVVTAKE